MFVHSIAQKFHTVSADPLETPTSENGEPRPGEPEPVDYPWDPFLSCDPLETNWGFGRRENQFNQLIQEAVTTGWQDETRPLDAKLFKALIAAESSFNPHARSRSGAVGLVQLMPGTARAHGLKLTPRDQRLQPERAIPAGVSVLKEKYRFLLNPPQNRDWGEKVAKAYQKFGLPDDDNLWRLSLAGYNGGASTVVKAMAEAYDRGFDPREWGNLVGDREQPTTTPLYQAVRETFGEERAASKYREMANYPDRVMGFFEIASKPLEGRRIMLDPGHGGKFPGAVGPSGLQEKEVTLDVCLKLRDKLQALGADVRMTRETDRTVAPPDATLGEDLAARVALANQWPAAFFISVHCNAAVNPQAHGTETYIARKASQRSQALARDIYRDMVDQLGLRGRGVKRANFHVIRNTTMPAVLVETAFLSNPIEESLLGDEEFRDRIAESIASGVVKYEQAQAVLRGEDPLDQFQPVEEPYEPIPSENLFP